jgi:hypothetical protein
VTKIRGILESLSLEPATPDEARAWLGLKGGDRVAFERQLPTLLPLLSSWRSTRGPTCRSEAMLACHASGASPWRGRGW